MAILTISTNIINGLSLDKINTLLDDIQTSKGQVDKTTLKALLSRQDSLLAGLSYYDIGTTSLSNVAEASLANAIGSSSGGGSGGGTPFTVIDWNPYTEGGTSELVFTPIDENTQYVDGVISVPSGNTASSAYNFKYMALSAEIPSDYLGKLEFSLDASSMLTSISIDIYLYSPEISAEVALTSWIDGDGVAIRLISRANALDAPGSSSNVIFTNTLDVLNNLNVTTDTGNYSDSVRPIYLFQNSEPIPTNYTNMLVVVYTYDEVTPGIPSTVLTQQSLLNAEVPETVDGNVIHIVGSSGILCDTIVSVDSYCQMYNEGSQFILLSKSDEDSGSSASASDVASNDVIWKGVDTVIPTMSLPFHALSVTIPANYEQSDTIYIDVKDTVRNGMLLIANPSGYDQTIVIQSNLSSFLIGGTLVGDKWQCEQSDGVGQAYTITAVSINATNGFIASNQFYLNYNSTMIPPGFAPTYFLYEDDLLNTGSFIWEGDADIYARVGIPPELSLPLYANNTEVTEEDIVNGYVRHRVLVWQYNQLYNNYLFGNNTLSESLYFNNNAGSGPEISSEEIMQILPEAPTYSNPEYSLTSGNTSASTYNLAVNCAGYSDGLGAPFKEGMILHISSDSSGAPEPTTSITLPYTILQSSPMIQVSGGGDYGLSIPYTLNSNGGTPYTIVFTAYWEADGLIGPTSTFTLNVTP